MYPAVNITHFLRELIRIMLIIGRNNWILLLAMKISLLIVLSEYFSKILEIVCKFSPRFVFLYQ
jgi:hypothetical protein